MKKLFIALAILSVCQIVGAVDVNGGDPNLYLQKIKELRQIVEAQQQEIDRLTIALADVRKQLAEQIEENERLKALYKEAGVVAVPQKTDFSFDNITYRGKKRTQRWFDMMYEKFSDKFIYSQGRYIDIGKNLVSPSSPHIAPRNMLSPGKMVWPIGSPVQLPGSVYDWELRKHLSPTALSVLGKGDILVQSYIGDVVVRIHGLKGDFVDGQDIPDSISKRLIYEGIYEYTSTLGAHKTVPSLIPYEPLTKEQFANLINSGVVLIEYKCKGDSYEIDSKPIP